MPELRSTVQADDSKGAYVELPEATVLALGAGKRPPLSAVINGVPYRTRVSVYGGRYYLGLRKDILAASGATPGSPAHIVLELDSEPRDVAIPAELAEALTAAPDAQASYEALSFTHRNEYARWIDEAKREETRRNRATKAVAMLRQGTRTPG